MLHIAGVYPTKILNSGLILVYAASEGYYSIEIAQR